MAVEIELNRLPDLSEKNHKASQLSSIPFLAEPCSYDQVISVPFAGLLHRGVKFFFFPVFHKLPARKPPLSLGKLGNSVLALPG